MAARNHPPDASSAAAVRAGRYRQAAFALAAAAAIFLALIALGALSPLPGLIGLVLLASVFIAGARHQDTAPTEPERPAAADDTIDALIAGMPEPVVVLDEEETVFAFNAAALAIAPALVRGEPMLLGLRIPEVVEVVRQAIRLGTAARTEFLQRVPADRWWDVVATPIALTGAPATARRLAIVVFRDLTPLRRIDEMRADFVANASHELRTPLAAVSGFIETLQGPARDDVAARDRFLAIMKAQATRMARLIDDLLSLSRIELNAHVPPRDRVDLLSIVRQVVDGLQPLAHERDVAIAITGAAAALPVTGDRDELIRVFENLVENALKYGASGKRVDIILGREAEGHEATVAIRDYGPGIAPEHLPRLTERFYRVDVGESRAQGGTGLGLALVKHILNRHHGRLTIESTFGKGATFTVRLPTAQA
ncbi:MAG TPA: ATP-binding protein [Xanthobacteraceae bacterium]|jgi:two-component system phosphate regulon sensor histidine kinase PhoR|nr:ATP-binding protein [Xanthobacteraceae bacterium]